MNYHSKDDNIAHLHQNIAEWQSIYGKFQEAEDLKVRDDLCQQLREINEIFRKAFEEIFEEIKDRQVRKDLRQQLCVHLHDIVAKFQEAYSKWQAVAEDQNQGDSLRQQIGVINERLWAMLAWDAESIAYGWMRSSFAWERLQHTNSWKDAVQSLAFTAFSYLLMAMPQLRLRASNTQSDTKSNNKPDNLFAYMRKIMWVGLYKENRHYSSDHGPSPGDSNEWHISGTDGHPQLPSDIADDIVNRLQHDYLKRIIADWKRSRTWQDQIIYELRAEEEHPVSHGDIAEILGDGWTEECVRQRWQRLRKNLREYLRGDDFSELTPSTL